MSANLINIGAFYTLNNEAIPKSSDYTLIERRKMKSQLSKLCLCVMILLTLAENRRIECFQRLLNRRLKSKEISGENFDAIRNIVSASLTANEPIATSNDEKSDLTIDRIDDKSPIVSEDDNNNNNVAGETRDASNYDDESEEEDEGQEQVRQVDRVAKSIDRQSKLANYDEPEPKDAKEVAKREVRNENEYEDDDDSEANPEGVDSSIEEDPKVKMIGRSTLEEKASAIDLDKSNKQRDTNSLVDDVSGLDYEKQIEDQIQQRIDSIKDDIKRQIEKKQQVREIEANNAKFDELEFPNDDQSDSSKRSLSADYSANESERSKLNVRSKRRSELDEVEKNEDSKNVPVKKRSLAKRVTLVERRDNRKRKDRSSILIPEQGHAEVKDDLPADLTLDPNLRISRSNKDKDYKSENSRPARSAPRLKDEFYGDRYRRDMSDELEDKINETPEESGNFLFAPRERSDSRGRRRRSRARNRTRSFADRGKARKHPRHLRRHRATRV